MFINKKTNYLLAIALLFTLMLGILACKEITGPSKERETLPELVSIIAVSVTVNTPIAGGLAVNNIAVPGDDSYRAEFSCWYIGGTAEYPGVKANESDTFIYGQSCVAEVMVYAEPGYKFSETATVTINGEAGYFVSAEQESRTYRAVFPCIGTPEAPTNLEALFSDGQITLSWTTPYNGGSPITGYQVLYSLADWPSDSWEDITDASASTTTYTVTGLMNNMSYSFEVRAVNIHGPGESSAAIKAMPGVVPDAPVLNAIPESNTDRVNLSWTKPAEGSSEITGYEFSYGKTGGYTQRWIPVPQSGSLPDSYTIVGLPYNIQHTFEVRALNEIGAGASSLQQTATPARRTNRASQVKLSTSAGTQILNYSYKFLDKDGRRVNEGPLDGENIVAEFDSINGILTLHNYKFGYISLDSSTSSINIAIILKGTNTISTNSASEASGIFVSTDNYIHISADSPASLHIKSISSQGTARAIVCREIIIDGHTNITIDAEALSTNGNSYRCYGIEALNYISITDSASLTANIKSLNSSTAQSGLYLSTANPRGMFFNTDGNITVNCSGTTNNPAALNARTGTYLLAQVGHMSLDWSSGSGGVPFYGDESKFVYNPDNFIVARDDDNKTMTFDWK